MNCYMDLVAKGLEGDVALLHVHGIVGEVHVAADVEVHPLAVAHHAVLVHLDRLGGVVKFGLPETIHNVVFHFFLTRQNLILITLLMKMSGLQSLLWSSGTFMR